MKHDIDNWASALTTTRVSYIVLKRYELWSTNGLKLDSHFHPPSENYAFFCNLTVTLTACIFGTKYDIDNRSSALTTTRVSYIISKCHELSSTNGFKLDRHVYPPYVNSAFYVIARLRTSSQKETSKQNSTTLCQTAEGKSR